MEEEEECIRIEGEEEEPNSISDEVNIFTFF